MSKSVERMVNARSHEVYPLGDEHTFETLEDEQLFKTLKEAAKQALIEMQEKRLKEMKTSFDLQSHIAPQLGERLLLLVLSKEERVNIPGDLEEEYRGIAAKHGARYAKLWYYKQVAASAWPIVRKAVSLGLLAWVAEWIRRRA